MPVNLYQKSATCFLLRDYEQAAACCLKVLETAPGHHEAWHILALARHGLGEHEQAIECCRKALELAPGEEVVWRSMGLAHRALGEHEQSIGCFRQALELRPDDYDTWHALALAHLSLGEIEPAIDCYARAPEVKPDNGEGWFPGAARYFSGNLDKSETYYRLAEMQTCSGNNVRAAEYCLKALEFNPDHQRAWFILGLNCYFLDNYENAGKCCLKAAELKPDDVGAWHHAGRFLCLSGDLEQALVCGFEAAALMPEEYDAWQLIGRIKLKLGQPEEAREQLLRAWKLSRPRRSGIALELGHSHLLQGDRAQSLKWYRKGLSRLSGQYEFLMAMDNDYDELQLERQGIGREQFQAIIGQIESKWRGQWQ